MNETGRQMMAKAKKKAAKPAKKTAAKTAKKAPARSVAKKATAKKAAPKKKGGILSAVTSTIAKIAGRNGAKKQNGNGLPKPSTKPQGQAGKALDGVKIL